MKKKAFCLLASSLLAVLLALGSFAGVPTLFHNDEAWYRDGAAPLIERDGVYYVPAELFELFSSVRVTEYADGSNLLICNTETGGYISVLLEKGRAAVNGEIIEEICAFRRDSVIYVDAVQVADIVGIKAETITHEDGGISMRFTDGNELLTTENLMNSYFPTESETDEFADLTENEKLDRKRIFILCREPAENSEYSALELLRGYDMGYTLFLSEETSTEFLLYALAGGEYGIITDTSGTGEETVLRLDTMNERFGKITHYKTHFTMTTGSYEDDEKLTSSAYCPVVPDFTVDSSTDADIMFADMLQYIGENNYCFLLLEDCPQTARMLELLDKIDREQFVTSNLGH